MTPLFRVAGRGRKRIAFYHPGRSAVADMGNADWEISEWNESATGSKHDHTDGSNIDELERLTKTSTRPTNRSTY